MTTVLNLLVFILSILSTRVSIEDVSDKIYKSSLIIIPYECNLNKFTSGDLEKIKEIVIRNTSRFDYFVLNRFQIDDTKKIIVGFSSCLDPKMLLMNNSRPSEIVIGATTFRNNKTRISKLIGNYITKRQTKTSFFLYPDNVFFCGNRLYEFLHDEHIETLKKISSVDLNILMEQSDFINHYNFKEYKSLRNFLVKICSLRVNRCLESDVIKPVISKFVDGIIKKDKLTDIEIFYLRLKVLWKIFHRIQGIWAFVRNDKTRCDSFLKEAENYDRKHTKVKNCYTLNMKNVNSINDIEITVKCGTDETKLDNDIFLFNNTLLVSILPKYLERKYVFVIKHRESICTFDTENVFAEQ